MEYYKKPQTENLNEEYLKDLNSHLPKWVNMLVELYTSPIKYEIKYKNTK